MKRIRRLGVTLALASLVVAGLLVSPASADPTTTGTWYSYPAQTYTDSSVVTQGSSYQTAVRPPINANGSSNWPAKRGVIPVQFDLLAAPSTTTTTTRTYDPPVWESLNGVSGSYSFAGIVLTSPLTFADITNLSAVYTFTTGDCFGGSLRWDIEVIHNGVHQVVEAYYGTPNGPDQSCSGANSGSGQNLISTGITDIRFEMLSGWGVVPSYTTYANALLSTNNGTDEVVGVQLTLDSGWMADQRANVSDVTVNDNTWVPKTTESSTSTVTGDPVKTCDLPDAEIRWAKNDGTPTGGINEDFSVQPKDTGQYYRQVDCKYIYNLDVSRLDGAGTYKVWARIGENLAEPAIFDLR